jgi:chromosome segregation ATPase
MIEEIKKETISNGTVTMSTWNKINSVIITLYDMERELLEKLDLWKPIENLKMDFEEWCGKQNEVKEIEMSINQNVENIKIEIGSIGSLRNDIDNLKMERGYFWTFLEEMKLELGKCQDSIGKINDTNENVEISIIEKIEQAKYENAEKVKNLEDNLLMKINGLKGIMTDDNKVVVEALNNSYGGICFVSNQISEAINETRSLIKEVGNVGMKQDG